MSQRVPIINRIAAVVEPKEPYYAWARALDDEEPSIDSMWREKMTSVYLIDEEEDAEDSLRRNWDWIFEEKLFSWHRDREAWPQERTYRSFREWFEVRLVGVVFDLSEYPLLQQDL